MRLIVPLPLIFILAVDAFTGQQSVLSKPLGYYNGDKAVAATCSFGNHHPSHLSASRKFVEVSRRKRFKEKLVNLWHSTKRWLSVGRRRRRNRYTVYVLLCENEKYYVGSTTNRKRRIREHSSERGGSKWTRLHKPVRLVKEYRRIPADYYLGKEAQVTAEFMWKHGINNVRGAMFAEPRPYTQEDIDALTGFLGHYNNLDYGELKEALEEDLVTKHRPPRRKKQKKKNRLKSRTKDKCFHCGEAGHWAYECPNR